MTAQQKLELRRKQRVSAARYWHGTTIEQRREMTRHAWSKFPNQPLSTGQMSITRGGHISTDAGLKKP